MKTSVVLLLVAIFFVSLLVFPTLGAQQSGQIISSQGVISGGGKLGWLHTDGAYIKNEAEEIVSLRGCAFIEPAYCIDELQHAYLGHTLADRAERLNELGVNFVRIPINLDYWDANTDTNGDGIGNRDFTDIAIQEFTRRGIYVIPGLHYGLKETERNIWANNPQVMIDRLLDLVNRWIDNPGVAGIYLLNEPQYNAWGGSNLGGGVTSGYWNAMKEACRQIHEANPNLLMIVHANMHNEAGFCPVLETDPIPTPNVIYTWHYYYLYGPIYDPYNPYGSGIPDPTYQRLKDTGKPYYQSYATGEYTKAKQEFEQSLYDRFLWVPTELNLPIINDEYGFNGDEFIYACVRICTECGWEGQLRGLLDAPNGNPVQPPYAGDGYCPTCGAYVPNPQPHMEPGWPQCMKDFHEIMNKYYCNWNFYSWWPKTYGGYGLCLDDMMTLSETGEVWKDYLNASAST